MKRKQMLILILSAVLLASGSGITVLADAQQSVVQDIQKPAGVSEVLNIASPSEAAENLNDDTEENLKQEISQEDADEERSQKDLDQETTQDDKTNTVTSTVLNARMELKASPSDAVYVSDENELREAVKSDKTVVLENDIQLSETLLIDSPRVSITSENGKLSCGTNFPDDTMILVRNGAVVTLSDIEIDATKMGNPLHEDWEYSALLVGQGSKLMIGDGMSLTNDRQQSPGVNPKKYGVEISGSGEMNGGQISGFSKAGIFVAKTGNFTLNDGEISNIVNVNYPDDDDPAGGLFAWGSVTINGGVIWGCDVGIFNSNQLVMNDGEIYNNQIGFLNLTGDGDGNVYYPKATINGGVIHDNSDLAVLNKNGGKFILPAGSEVQIIGKRKGLSNFRIMASSVNAAYVIKNLQKAELNIQGGHIISEFDNEIAVFNDKTGKISMTNGTITVSGTQSIAIANENDSTGEVKISGGSIKVSGEGSRALNGSAEITKEVVVEEPGTGSNNGGNSNSGGSSGGSGSSGSSGFHSSKASSATSPEIPETPGAWNQDQRGWKFAKPDGSNYTNEWVYVKSCWYRIGADGYMLQGWNAINDKVYYLVPVSGEMKIGWLLDNNNWYYLEESGAMKTGWVQVNGKWYYFNEDGRMASDTVTPDGYRVGLDGAWLQ